jgi:hypothetical protein
LKFHINTTTFSTVSSQSVNDVFSANYDIYKLFITTTQNFSNQLGIRLRVSSTDATTDYVTASAQLEYTGTPDWSLNNTALGTSSANIAFNGSRVEVTIYNPFKSEVTDFATFGARSQSARLTLSSSQHDSATSYTGFTLLPSGNTITGSVVTFGVQN